MSVQATTWVWEHSTSKGTDRLVLLAIADAANREGKRSCQSANSIAKMTGVSIRSVWRSVSALETLGEIVNVGTHGQYQTSVYELVGMSNWHSDNMARRDKSTGVGVPNQQVGVPPIGTRPHKTPVNPKRASAINENFEPSQKLLDWAETNTPLVDVRLETAQFIDHHIAKGSTMKDWDRAWMTWMRNQQKWSKPKQQQPAADTSWMTR